MLRPRRRDACLTASDVLRQNRKVMYAAQVMHCLRQSEGESRPWYCLFCKAGQEQNVIRMLEEHGAKPIKLSSLLLRNLRQQQGEIK